MNPSLYTYIYIYVKISIFTLNYISACMCLHTEKAFVIPVPQKKHNLLPNLQSPKKEDSYGAKNILTEPQKSWSSNKKDCVSI